MSGIHTHIAVGIPHCGRPLVLPWVFRLLTQNWPIGINIAWIGIDDRELPPDLPMADRIGMIREALVSQARSLNAHYLWMIDDDTEPPIHAARYLLRVLDADPSIAICAGIYGTKEPEPQPLVWRKVGYPPATFRENEIFPCEVIGAGCMMIRMSVFDEIPRPYFRFTDPDCVASVHSSYVQYSDRMGEDAYFIRKVLDAGYGVMAHGGVLCTHWDTDTKTPYRLPEIVKFDIGTRFLEARHA